MTAVLYLWAAYLLIAITHAFEFRDVSREAGLDYRRGAWLKFGGAAVADLDGDGCPDLLFTHHGAGHPAELYFNECDGTFKKSAFREYGDIHGLTPIRLNARDKRMYFILTTGGARGNQPRGSRLFQIAWNRSVKEVSKQRGLVELFQRGRTALSIDLVPTWLSKKRNNAGARDLLITSGSIKNVTTATAAFRTLASGFLKRQKITGDFAIERDIEFVLPVDPQNDGAMRILSLQRPRVYEPKGFFYLTDISKDVFPSRFSNGLLKGVGTAAEADFNNDLIWDLYLGRHSKGHQVWLERKRAFNPFDILFFGTSSHTYKDVSRFAGIPRDVHTKGVTTGDFNNDGWVDIIVIVFEGPDLFLINKGNGRFTVKEASWEKIGNAVGDTATAVDYDNDGRLDVIVSEGHWTDKNRMGFFRIMKNVMNIPAKLGESKANYLLVRVGSSQSFRASSLYAVVRIRVAGLNMMRRVGTPGVVVSLSYIETVHFGIGEKTLVDYLEVTWTDGSMQARTNITPNTLVKVGSF